MPYTIDYESVNGGIYRSRETAGTLKAARRLVRESLRGLSSFHMVFIADAETGRRIEYGGRRLRGRQYGDSWAFQPVATMTRVQLHDALVRFMGYEDTAYALAIVDEHGEYPFSRHDDYGTLHYAARYFPGHGYALYKIP